MADGRKRVAAAACCLMALLASAATIAGEGRIVELSHAFPGYHGSGRSGIAAGDVDGDGVDDFVFGATVSSDQAGSSLMFVAGRLADGSMGLKQSLLVPSPELIRISAVSRDGETRIYAVASNGTVMTYGGWPLRILRSFATLDDIKAAVIGDVNNDGDDEVVVAEHIRMEAYRLDTGDRLWQTIDTRVSTPIALAQLDADASLEIACGGWSGLVIDGATGAAEGIRAGGFGSMVFSGKLDHQAGTRIVGAYTNSNVPFSVFDGADPWSVAWTFDPGSTYIGTMSLTDVLGQGTDQIVLGSSGGSNELRIIDGVSRTEQLPPLPTTYHGARAISPVAGSDASRQLAVVTDRDYWRLTVRSGAFEVIDLQSRSNALLIGEVSRRFGAVAAGDADGDGHADLVIGASPLAAFAGGAIHVVDPQSGQLIWATSDATPEVRAEFDTVAAVAVVKLLPQGSPDIVLAGDWHSSGAITVLDGVTRQVRLRIYQYGEGPLASRLVRAVVFRDHDGDAINDVIAVTRGGPQSAGVAIHVFSGANGALLGESAVLPLASADTVNNVLLIDGESGPELVVGTTHAIHGLDARTLEWGWTIPATSGGIRHVNGDNGSRQLMTFNPDGGISFYDASTHAFVRSIATTGRVSAVLALGDDVRNLVTAGDGFLRLLDGLTGELRASSDYLGSGLALNGQLVSIPVDGQGWQVLTGADAGYFRHRIDLTEMIFAGNFDAAAP